MRTIRQLTILTALAVLAACGGGDGPTEPSGPDIRGTYTGSPPQGGHSFTIQIGEADPTVIRCAGAMMVTSSSGGNFGGALRVNPCDFVGIEDPVDIPILSGTVQENGSVRFNLVGQDAIIEGLQEEGCEVLEADDAFTGNAQGASFTAEIEALVRCDDVEGDAAVTWSFQGTRQN